MKKSLFLRCLPELKEKLKKRAEQIGVSLNALIVNVLRQYAEKEAQA